MLDGRQREAALLGKSRGEKGNKTIELSGKKMGLDGIRVGDMSGDQKGHVRKVLGENLLRVMEEVEGERDWLSDGHANGAGI